jgi:hypothetical protein
MIRRYCLFRSVTPPNIRIGPAAQRPPRACNPRAKSEYLVTSLHAASAGSLPVSNATLTQAVAGASSELEEFVSW